MNAKRFDTFEAEPVYNEKGWLFGSGRCGGKAKGLAFALNALKNSPLVSQVRFPDFTYVLSTEIFNDFIENNELEYLYEEEDWQKAQEAVNSGKMRSSLKLDLECVVNEAQGKPLAARSSSLMEDSVALSFAGKYATCFPSFQGSLDDRIEALQDCIKTVWASVFNPSARAYRQKHRWDHRIESMAVLLQPVVGKTRGDMYYPELAGTLFSRVFRRPSPRVKKEDGLMRLCFGLGTRTVDRNYARVFYLTNPYLRPDGNSPAQIADSAQETFDYINLTKSEFSEQTMSDATLKFIMKNHKNASAFIERYGYQNLFSVLTEPEEPSRHIISFSGLPKRCPHLFELSAKLMSWLESSMEIPVDIEFAYDTETKDFCLLQLRPLASYAEGVTVTIPDIEQDKILLKGDRMISSGRLENVENLVYVDPQSYMKNWNPRAVVQAVSEFNSQLKDTSYILIGPGRWGSSNASLGVPVIYADICNSGCLVELSLPQYSFTPELSYGTHFFLDMDNDGTLYLPVFAGQSGNIFCDKFFKNTAYLQGAHPSVRLYSGPFDVFLDGDKETGIVCLK